MYTDTAIIQWIQSALRYQDLALAGLNKVLSNINLENCEPAAISSIMVFLLSSAIPGVCDDPNDISRDPIADLLAIRKLLQGISIIIMQVSTRIAPLFLCDCFTLFLSMWQLLTA